MEIPVVLDGEPVGSCILTEQGLYWQIHCSCALISDRVERLYCGRTRLGVLIREGDRLILRRRLSPASQSEI